MPLKHTLHDFLRLRDLASHSASSDAAWDDYLEALMELRDDVEAEIERLDGEEAEGE